MISLPNLPYSMDALEPAISARTLEFHYGKHHQAYVNNTNNLIKGTSLENAELENIVREAAKHPDMLGLFNNAAQVYNHTFYWNCLNPKKTEPSNDLRKLIDDSFGSMDEFMNQFKQAAATLFGSGWAWLVLDQDKAIIRKFGNADTPMIHGLKPLLTIDVWEHAYYLDYQNRRPDYIHAVVDQLINWDFVSRQLEK